MTFNCLISLSTAKRPRNAETLCAAVCRAGLSLSVVAVAVATAGCGDDRPAMAPVEGVVRLDGKPLAFGGVLFQPESGFPAQGAIEPDGTFKLSTYSNNDGAAIGKHRVQVTCYEGQSPNRSLTAGGDDELGRSLVPQRYTNFATSGIEVEVKEQNDPVVIELEGK